MFHKTTFEVAGVKTDQEVIRGTSKQDSFGLTHDGRVCVQEGAQARNIYVHTRLCSLGEHDRYESRN